MTAPTLRHPFPVVPPQTRRSKSFRRITFDHAEPPIRRHASSHAHPRTRSSDVPRRIRRSVSRSVSLPWNSGWGAFSLRTKKVAGFEDLDYISNRNTGDPGLEDVVGPESIQIHCIVSGSSLMASPLR